MPRGACADRADRGAAPGFETTKCGISCYTIIKVRRIRELRRNATRRRDACGGLYDLCG